MLNNRRVPFSNAPQNGIQNYFSFFLKGALENSTLRNPK